MIVTLTANPSVDRTVEVETLVRGAVLRALTARVDPGGKGVNVSRALAASGAKTVAVLPAGGAEGLQLAALLAAEGIEVVPVPITGSVRANVSVVEPDGTVTKLNEPGPALTADEVEALLVATVEVAGGADWVVASGTVPPATRVSFYAELIDRLHGSGVRVAIDSSGAALTAAIAAGPDVLKPNREELAEISGRPIATIRDVVDAAHALRAMGARTVLASLGADGAVLVDDDGVVHGEAHIDEPRSAVGAGDAMLAGFIAAGGCGRVALAEALAWGAAAASLPGSSMPTPADLDRVSVQIHDDPDLTRVLKGLN